MKSKRGQVVKQVVKMMVELLTLAHFCAKPAYLAHYLGMFHAKSEKCAKSVIALARQTAQQILESPATDSRNCHPASDEIRPSDTFRAVPRFAAGRPVSHILRSISRFPRKEKGAYKGEKPAF
jgi:hypothetical protein